MNKEIIYSYEPDYAVPPGETLAEILEAMGMSQAELARRTGLHTKTINEIIKGKAPITAETAQQLENVLGVPARLWNNLEINYRQRLAQLEEIKRLRTQSGWLKSIGIPKRTMINLGWIAENKDKANTAKEIYRFLGVTSLRSFQQVYGNLQVEFRKSTAFECNQGSLAVWLRKGEIEARSIECGPYDKEGFLTALNRIPTLSRKEPKEFLPEIQRLCAPVGVAVVYVPSLPKCPVSGASRWLAKEKALIQLSGRYKKDDHFWFTFFHEAGHIVLHSRDSKKAIFLDDDSHKTGDHKEKQANRFASNWLIRSEVMGEIKALCIGSEPNEELILEFAERLGISPGIVIGRLQHEKLISFKSALNHLKRNVEFA